MNERDKRLKKNEEERKLELQRYEANKLKLNLQIQEKSLLTDKHMKSVDENAWRYSTERSP